MKIIALISILLYTPLALAAEDCTSHPGNVHERIQCFSDEEKLSQNEMEKFYSQLLSKLDETEEINDLKQSQIKWEKFKEANCKFYKSSSPTRYGIAAIQCRTYINTQRATELKRFITLNF